MVITSILLVVAYSVIAFFTVAKLGQNVIRRGKGWKFWALVVLGGPLLWGALGFNYVVFRSH